jgi:predicted nucleotidyltransferase
MGKEIDKIKQEALDFISRIKGFQIEKAIIFGSRIRGDYLENSDLDIILVSSDFSGIPFTDRMTRIYEFYSHWKAPYSLEILCYTPEEFTRKKRMIGLVQDASREGIYLTPLIHSRGRKVRLRRITEARRNFCEYELTGLTKKSGTS